MDDSFLAFRKFGFFVYKKSFPAEVAIKRQVCIQLERLNCWEIFRLSHRRTDTRSVIFGFFFHYYPRSITQSILLKIFYYFTLFRDFLVL